ncbi:MAG TPA: hypothetical protein VKZ96_02695 [Thermomicrobiales bacterium]|nr:hypothetical protein [Thermomicrobiales bacterium]
MTTTRTRPDDLTLIREQATHLRQTYPELFAHLVARDRKLERAMKRIPSPADIELSAAWDQRAFFARTLATCGAGIEELVDGQHQR